MRRPRPFVSTPLVTAFLLALPLAGSSQGQTLGRSPEDVATRKVAIRDIADTLRTERPDHAWLPVPKGWKPARTPWGDPDIEGIYTNSDEWGIPFERPAAFEARRLDSITTEELARLREARRDGWIERLATEAPREPGTIGWYDIFNAKNSRAWLVVDPPDGRIPPFTAAGKQRADAAAAMLAEPRAADSYTERSIYARCISRGFPGSMMPESYGSNYEIHQAPGNVAIRYEMIHETRVIPLDDFPRIGSAIRSYMGSPRGRWDGDTLVVETTNFRALTDGPGAVRTAFRGADVAALRLVERFAPKGPGTLEWAVTVDEPGTWTRAWTFAMLLTKADRTQQPYEFACHEGNYGLRNILETARALEKQEQDADRVGATPAR